MVNYQDFKKKGYNFFIGVPDTQLKGFVNEILADKEMTYVPATREDVAVGVAIGAYMAGKKPLVFLQNSGLGHTVNIVTSMMKPYGISIHFLISMRAQPFEHTFMYQITRDLLKLLQYDNFTVIDESAKQGLHA